MTKTFGVAILFAVAVLPQQLAAQDSLLAARSKGAKNAPVTVYEMADFACPYCRTFAMTTLPIIDKEYIATGKVRWIFINMPLTQIHPNAERAAEFAACASKQGKFWQTHDKLYSQQDQWETLQDPRQYLMLQIANLDLNPKTMTACLNDGVGRTMVADDAAGAARAGATGTPTFYIEGGMMSGAQPIDVFRKILDSVYTVRTKKVKP